MSKLVVQPGILEIAPYVPGRDSVDGGGSVIKLSSNETPLGTSPKAIAAYQQLADGLHRYPDPGALPLREAIGRRYGLDPDRIICGNGSDELILLLAQAYAGPGDEVLMTEHAFAMYKIAAQMVGATAVTVPETRLTADVDALLARATPRTRICYLANPNNPTGTYIPIDDVARLRAGLPDQTLLVLDSAYAEYMRRNDYAAGASMVDAHDNVVMTRTFSKIYGLCALRLGWMYAPAGVVDVLHRIRAPFNVNMAAQVAGCAALDDTAFIDAAVAHNTQWLPWLEREIAALDLTIHPSTANFVLIEFPETPGQTAADAYDAMLARRIIGRRVANYGLPNCLRYSVGLQSENEALVAGLRAFVKA